MKINIKIVYKLNISFLVFLARHVQNTQNNGFAVSFQYIEKEMSGEVDFLYTEKYQSFLQVDTFIFLWVWSDMSKVLKTMGLQYVRNDMLDYLDFLYVNRLPDHNQSIEKSKSTTS